MKENDVIEGADITEGMKVQRLIDGKPCHHPMIVYSDSPYLNNRLYADDEFTFLGHEYNAD